MVHKESAGRIAGGDLLSFRHVRGQRTRTHLTCTLSSLSSVGWNNCIYFTNLSPLDRISTLAIINCDVWLRETRDTGMPQYMAVVLCYLNTLYRGIILEKYIAWSYVLGINLDSSRSLWIPFLELSNSKNKEIDTGSIKKNVPGSRCGALVCVGLIFTYLSSLSYIC